MNSKAKPSVCRMSRVPYSPSVPPSYGLRIFICTLHFAYEAAYVCLQQPPTSERFLCEEADNRIMKSFRTRENMMMSTHQYAARCGVSFLLLMILSPWCATNIIMVSCQDVASVSHEELSGLTDAELEKICLKRGFELQYQVDATTGEKMQPSHDDYIEAAKQCLAIEKEL
jgi:hypothetical protein